MSSHPDAREPDPRRTLLVRQLEIPWSFATRFVLPAIDRETSLWEPSGNVVTVREQHGRWHADQPDEEASPLPEVTIAWLLWHVEWWWGNAARALRGAAPLAPDGHAWTGSTAGVEAAKADWDTLLAEADLDSTVEHLMPSPEPAGFVAAWVNFELTKNIAEMHQLLVRKQNSTAGS